MPNNPATKKSEKHVPFFSKDQKMIFRWYLYTALMFSCIIGGILAAYVSLFYTSHTVQAGGITLLWRVPLFFVWTSWAAYAWYMLAKFWDPADVAWVEALATKLKMRLRLRSK